MMDGKHNPGEPGSAGRRILGRWVGWVQRHAKLVMAASLLLTVALFAVSASTIQINTDTEDMLSPELSFRKLDKAQRQAFPQYSDVIVVVLDGVSSDSTADAASRLTSELKARPELFRTVFYPASEPFFQQSGLLYGDVDELSEMADRIAESQGLLARLASDQSLRGFLGVLELALEQMGAQEGTETATLAALLDRVAQVAAAQAQGRPESLSWRDVLRGQPALPGERRQLILVQPRLDHESLQPANAAIAELRDLARDLDLQHAGVSLRLTGSAALEQEELKTVEQNMGMIGLISFLLVAGLLFIGLRSLRLGLATMVTLVIGLVWTAGYAAIAIGHLNLLSVAFAVLFIGLSVDFGIHYGLRAKEGFDLGDANSALTRAGESVGGALALSALTAAIGFVSFVPTAYIGLAELGIISAGGMVIALIANLTVLPALLTLMPPSVGRPRRSRSAPIAGHMRGALNRHSGKVAAAGLLLGLCATAALPFARFDFDPMNLRDPKTESVRTLLDLMGDSQTNPYAVTVLTRDIESGRTVERRLERLPQVEGVISIDDLVPAEQDEKLDIIAGLSGMMIPVLSPDPAPPQRASDRARAWRNFTAALHQTAAGSGPLAGPARRLAAAFERLGGGGVPGDATLRELEHRLIGGLPARLDELRASLAAEPVALEDLPAYIKERMVAADGRSRLQVLPAGNMRDPAQMREFIQAVRSVAPDVTGAPVVIMEAGDAVVDAFWQASATALLVITLLLLAILRSVRDTLLVLTPLSIAALMLVATTVILDLPFNFANVIVLPLLFGLGVANGIHFVMRSRLEARSETAMDVLGTSTPRAIIFSALTTVASFGSLALSDHKGTASMGILLTIAIGYTLLATLVILPTMSNWLARRGEGRA